jgi:DUF4097 and DUF4098 domain-containing protein YvlB
MVVTGIALAFVLAQAPAPRQAAPQTDETVAVQRGARLNINNHAGEVVVRTWDKDSVRVVARHQPRTRVSIRPTSAGLSIGTSGSMGPAGSVDFEITAPPWMAMRIEGAFNFVTVDGVQSEVFANTVRGDVIIKGGSGVVTAKSVEGEVLVEGARGKIIASSVNERITITGATGDITAETVNGDITMTGIDSRSVDATTVNGNIAFEGKLADRGHYALSTHNGDIGMGLPDSNNATFTFRTYRGSVATDFTLAGYNREDAQRGRRAVATLGNGSADVNLETFGGTIRLRKGPVARPRAR